MAKTSIGPEDYSRPLRRLLVGVLLVLLLGLFLLWRIDSPRVERFRAALVDAVVPNLEWALVPVAEFAGMVDDFQSYTRIYEQNQELKRELQKMKAWKEAAEQLEMKNARLLDLNQVRLDPKLTHVTGVVMADSGSPFRQSVLLNVGSRDGIRDGWATMDGIGFVGRISGVGERTSRVILVTDSNSRVPVTIQPSGQKAILSGDNSPIPLLEFIEDSDEVRPGDRVITSGDGTVLPAGLLVGQVVRGTDRRLRVVLSADYQRLEFLRVLRSHEIEPITDPGGLIAPPLLPSDPAPVIDGEGEAAAPPVPGGGDVGETGSGDTEGGSTSGASGSLPATRPLLRPQGRRRTARRDGAVAGALPPVRPKPEGTR